MRYSNADVLEIGMRLYRVALLLLVGGLYAAACCVPAVEYLPPVNRDFGDITPYGSVPGIVALLFGPGSEARIAWSANLFLLAGCILLLCKKDVLALITGAASVLIGLSTWAFVSDQMKLLVGYYLWQGSMVGFTLGVVVIKLCQPAVKDPNSMSSTSHASAEERLPVGS
jgi:hypothetical protein